jgi:hypothetical protein
MKSLESPSRHLTRRKSLFYYGSPRPCDRHLVALRLHLQHLLPVATARGVFSFISIWVPHVCKFCKYSRVFSLAKVTSASAHLLSNRAPRQPLYPGARLLCRRWNTESVEIVTMGLVQASENGQTTRLVFCLTPPMAMTCRFPSQLASTHDQGHKMRGIQTVAP